MLGSPNCQLSKTVVFELLKIPVYVTPVILIGTIWLLAIWGTSFWIQVFSIIAYYNFFWFLAESQCQDQCNVVNESKCHRPRPNVISCWNSTECQSCKKNNYEIVLIVFLVCPYYKFENGTFGPGCDEKGEMCHDYCLGGCSAPNDPVSHNWIIIKKKEHPFNN